MRYGQHKKKFKYIKKKKFTRFVPFNNNKQSISRHLKSIPGVLSTNTNFLGYWNKFQRYKKFIFFNSIIKSTVKSGKLLKSYKILVAFIKIFKKKYKTSLNKIITKVYLNSTPTIGFKNWHLGKIKYKVPYYSLNNIKHIKLASNWFTNSIKRNYKNKSKLQDRFCKELTGVFLKNPKTETIKKKREYYTDFFRNRSSIRFLKLLKSNKKSK